MKERINYNYKVDELKAAIAALVDTMHPQGFNTSVDSINERSARQLLITLHKMGWRLVSIRPGTHR